MMKKMILMRKKTDLGDSERALEAIVDLTGFMGLLRLPEDQRLVPTDGFEVNPVSFWPLLLPRVPSFTLLLVFRGAGGGGGGGGLSSLRIIYPVKCEERLNQK